MPRHTRAPLLARNSNSNSRNPGGPIITGDQPAKTPRIMPGSSVGPDLDKMAKETQRRSQAAINKWHVTRGSDPKTNVPSGVAAGLVQRSRKR